MSTTASRTHASPIASPATQRTGHPRLLSLAFAGSVTDRAGDAALLVARLIVGAAFVGHGGQKLFGWWGGEGIAGTGAGFEQAGLSPGEPLAVLAGSGEFFGGILLILGLLTRLGAFAIATTMVVAIISMHLPGPFLGGYELPLALLGIALVFLAVGAGRISLDALVRNRLNATADSGPQAHRAHPSRS